MGLAHSASACGEAMRCHICPAGRFSASTRNVLSAATGCAWKPTPPRGAAVAAGRFTTCRRPWRLVCGLGRSRRGIARSGVPADRRTSFCARNSALLPHRSVWFAIQNGRKRSERPVGEPAALGHGGNGGAEIQGWPPARLPRRFPSLVFRRIGQPSSNPRSSCVRAPAASIGQ